MGARHWDVFPLFGTGPSSTWTIDQLGSQSFMPISSVGTGGYIRRVRVQGSFSLLVVDTNPSVTEMRNDTPGIFGITFGVWADKTGVSVPSQTPPQTGTLDDSWVYWDQMTLEYSESFHTQAPDDRWFATWTFPYNDNDSTSSRGPFQVTSDVVLSWGFYSPGYNPLTDVVPDLLPFYDYTMTWSVLIEEP